LRFLLPRERDFDDLMDAFRQAFRLNGALWPWPQQRGAHGSSVFGD